LSRKNIRLLAGKPLLFWSIDAALEANIFHDVCVSTESLEVTQIVRDKYSPAEVKIIRRPPALASDSASLNDVCIHYLEQAPMVDYLSLMMPTYPFRRASRIIEEIIPPLYSGQIDLVNSVRYGNFSTFDYWIHHGCSFTRMYTRIPLWCGAGSACYHFQRRELFFIPPHQWPHAIGERALRIQTDYIESVDIDTQADLDRAEKIGAGFRPRYKKLVRCGDSYIDLIMPEGADCNAFLEYLSTKNVSKSLPILILVPADPLCTFLRIRECGSTMKFVTDSTNRMIASLPDSGHSQDVPLHYLHSQNYRVLRKIFDRNGIPDEVVPASQVIFEKDIKNEWPYYIEPIVWDKGSAITPLSRSLSIMMSTQSCRVSTEVSNSMSGDSGGSYGDEMPV